MKCFKNLIVIIDRSIEYEIRKGFIVLVLVGVWDFEVGYFKRIIFREFNFKYVKKYGSVKKVKMDMLKVVFKGECINFISYLYFIRVYRILVIGKICDRDFLQCFYDDFEEFYFDCKFIFGDKDIILILK